MITPQGMKRQGEGRSVPARERAFMGCLQAPTSRAQVTVEDLLIPPQHGYVYVFVGPCELGEEQVDGPAAAEAPGAGKARHEVVNGPNGGESLHIFFRRVVAGVVACLPGAPVASSFHTATIGLVRARPFSGHLFHRTEPPPPSCHRNVAKYSKFATQISKWLGNLARHVVLPHDTSLDESPSLSQFLQPNMHAIAC